MFGNQKTQKRVNYLVFSAQKLICFHSFHSSIFFILCQFELQRGLYFTKEKYALNDQIPMHVT